MHPLRVTVPLRVRYGECDAQGIVFNAHYVAWMDVANTELWRAAVGSYTALAADHGVDVVVAEVSVRYRAPARFDEELELETWFDAIGSTSMTARCDVRRGGELLAEGTVRYVMVETAGWTKVPVPSPLRVALGHAP